MCFTCFPCLPTCKTCHALPALHCLSAIPCPICLALAACAFLPCCTLPTFLASSPSKAACQPSFPLFAWLLCLACLPYMPTWLFYQIDCLAMCQFCRVLPACLVLPTIPGCLDRLSGVPCLPTFHALSAHQHFRHLCQPAHPRLPVHSFACQPTCLHASPVLHASLPCPPAWAPCCVLTCLSSVSIIQISSKAHSTSYSVGIQLTCLCHEANDILLISCSC
jgi:hypothetical protein